MPESLRPHADMSDYEATAWNQLLERVQRRENRRTARPVEKITGLAEATNKRLEAFFEDHENAKAVAEAFSKPVTGLQTLLTRFATSTVSDRRTVRRAARRDPNITSLTGLRAANLEIPDRMFRRHTVAYGVALAAEGAGTSLLITGFIVSSTVTGGTTLAAVAAAVAADVTANLAAASRLVADVAISYGYDPALPDEQLFALGVLNYGTTLTAGGKAASLAELSRLVQTMMRHPTHAVLDKFILVKVTREFLERLGFLMTHRRLAQVVPFVGVAVNAGINAASIMTLGDRAQDAYRLRFLTEKYKLDAATWLAEHKEDEDLDDDSIDIEALIREAEAEELQSDGQPGA
jgi:hypothetical protein